MEAPPGIDPHDSRKSTIYAVITSMLGLAAIAVSLRVYTRMVLLRQFGIDDYISIFTFFMIFGCGFCMAWMTRYGFGTHVYFLNGEEIKLYMKTFYVSIIFYNASLLGIKMTFLFQYWRVLAVRKMRNILIAAIVIIGGWSASQVFVQIFICTPVDKFWDLSVNGTCIPNYPQWYINAGGNIISDVIVFVLPLPVIGKLHLAKGQKYILIGIFCLGFFTCAISFVRIRFLQLSEDFTWTNVEAAGWSIGELSCGIICACLPTLRPLVGRSISNNSSRFTKSLRYAQQVDSESAGESKMGYKNGDVELSVAKLDPNSSESREDLYANASYDLDQSRSLENSESDLPIQGKDGSPKLPPKDFKQRARVLWPGNGAVVKTHIAAGKHTPELHNMQSNGPIHVECNIVQVESQRKDGEVFP